MSNVLNQDFGGSESEDDDFNPEPAVGSDNEEDNKQEVKPSSSRRAVPNDDDDDEDKQPNGASKSRRDDNEDDEDVKEDDEDEDDAPKRQNRDQGEGEDEEDDEEEEEEEEEDEDEAVTVRSRCRILESRQANSCRATAESADAETLETSSSMSKPKLTRKMKKSWTKTTSSQAMRCTLMTCWNYHLVLIETTVNTENLIVNEIWRPLWTQKSKPKCSEKDTDEAEPRLSIRP